LTYFILVVAFVVVIAVVASASAKDEPAAAAANPSASAKQERAGYMARLEQHLRESDVETARIKKTIPNSTSLETVEAAIRDYERLFQPDVIVAGLRGRARPRGATASYALAKAGMRVVAIEAC
jgi:hypothetical protein